jgi:hypothetical protein
MNLIPFGELLVVAVVDDRVYLILDVLIFQREERYCALCFELVEEVGDIKEVSNKSELS